MNASLNRLLAAASVVLRKELRDLMRDRRTALMTLITAALSGPLVLLLMLSLITNRSERAADISLPVAGAQYAPALISALQRAQIKIAPPVAQAQHEITEGRLAAQLEIDADYPRAIREGRPAALRLYFDASREKTSEVVRQVRRVLMAYDRQFGDSRLVARGIATTVAHPLAIEEVDLATPQQSAATVLIMLSFYGLMSALVGGLACAVDITAGERERSSLEPLLGLPVPRTAIALGKWGAVALFNACVVLLTCLGFALSTQYLPLPRVGLPFVFGWAEFARFLLILAPLVALYPAALLVLGCFGRSFKEAQTNAAYFLLLANLVPLINLFTGSTRARWLDGVPIISQSRLLDATLRGDPFVLTDWLLASCPPLVLCAGLVMVFAWLLGHERVLSGK